MKKQMISTSFYSALSLAATLMLAATAQAGPVTHVVKNGGFETQTGSNLGGYCYTYQAGCTLADWTSSGNTVVIGANSGAWGGPSSLANGQTGLGSFVLGLQGTDAKLSQYLTLDAGTQVALSWFDAGRSNWSNGLQSYEVSFAGASLGIFSNSVGQGWNQHNLAFTASGSGALQFRSLHVSDFDRTSFINGIDAVASISQVPEPQSFALVLMGLAAVAVARRRSPRA
ncbi:PEP-CTERM sorting domain-containing protein [Paucibacter sp. B2R-40]|uniref:PEP-CTERM sorting domain-containing protein n=1 Tax=Paucibacter sp. B2R-40 TaxID=2893554 RepID=UPI0021E4088C|nr:PEP-CTERM sorting domain-containing protein [Paucibacter sp. B2R-40]MCV2354203.1 PEP-CTERM sorting domain-containing protein [Paucibacter sp. B2R-40]